jgi:hypothetical protein
MKKPLIRPGSNINSVDTYVSTDAVRKALTLLEAGHTTRALHTLRHLCPDVPELPPFEIV